MVHFCFLLIVAPPEIESFSPVGEVLPNIRQWTITFDKEVSKSTEINVKKILAVINETYAVAKRKPEKNQACRDSNPDLCDTGAAL